MDGSAKQVEAAARRVLYPRFEHEGLVRADLYSRRQENVHFIVVSPFDE